MVATDNQILMAASQIAAGVLANSNFLDGDLNTLAKKSVMLALAIAGQIPEAETSHKPSDEEILTILKKYCKSSEPIPAGKLNSNICTGEGFTGKKAYNVIYRGEFLGYIENIGTNRAQYILRAK